MTKGRVGGWKSEIALIKNRDAQQDKVGGVEPKKGKKKCVHSGREPAQKNTQRGQDGKKTGYEPEIRGRTGQNCVKRCRLEREVENAQRKKKVSVRKRLEKGTVVYSRREGGRKSRKGGRKKGKTCKRTHLKSVRLKT